MDAFASLGKKKSPGPNPKVTEPEGGPGGVKPLFGVANRGQRENCSGKEGGEGTSPFEEPKRLRKSPH